MHISFKTPSLLATLALLSACSGTALPVASGNTPASSAGPVSNGTAQDASAKALLAIAFPAGGHPCNQYGYLSQYHTALDVAVNGKQVQSYNVSGFTKVRESFAIPTGHDRIKLSLSSNSRAVSEATVDVDAVSGRSVTLKPVFGGIPAGVDLSTPQLNPPTGKSSALPISFLARDANYNTISCGGPFPNSIRVYVTNADHSVTPGNASIVKPGDSLSFTYDGKLLSHPFTIGLKNATYPLSFTVNPYQTFKVGYAVVALAPADNGAVWFSHCKQAAVGPCSIRRLNADGTTGGFGVKFQFVQSLAIGPDGNLWFAEGFRGRKDGGGVVGKIDAKGNAVTYAIPKGFEPDVEGIVSGPGKRLWFTDAGYIGNITTDGKVTEYYERADSPIVAAPDRVYYENDYFQICAIDLGGNNKCFKTPSGGNYTPLLWYRDELLADAPGGVVAVGSTGKVTKIQSAPFTPLTNVGGQLWGRSYEGGLARIAYSRNAFTGVAYPMPSSMTEKGIAAVVPSSDGHLWIFPGYGDSIERFEPAI